MHILDNNADFSTSMSTFIFTFYISFKDRLANTTKLKGWSSFVIMKKLFVISIWKYDGNTVDTYSLLQDRLLK